MPFPIGKSAVGIGLEATPGTPVAAAFWLPATTLNPTESVPMLLDQSMRGSAAKDYGSQPGPSSVAYALAGNLIPDAVGFPLVGVLGEDVVTGATAPYSHAVALYNGSNFQAPSYTLVDVNGLEANSYAGVKFSDFVLSLKDQDLGTWTASAVGSAVASSSSLPTTSYSTTAPIASWRSVVTVGGSADSRQTDLELSMKRSVTPIFTLKNSQTAYVIFGDGDLEVTGKLTGVYEVATYRDLFRSGASTTLDVVISNGGTGAGLASLEVKCSQIVFGKADVTRGKTYVELDAEFTAIANSTDVGASGGLSPVKVTLTNAVAAGTYHA